MKPPSNALILGGLSKEDELFETLAKAQEHCNVLRQLVILSDAQYNTTNEQRLEKKVLTFLAQIFGAEDMARFAWDYAKNQIPFIYGDQRFFNTTVYANADDFQEFQKIIRITSVPLIYDREGKEGYVIFPKQYSAGSLIELFQHREELRQIPYHALPSEQQSLLQNAAEQLQSFIKTCQRGQYD